MNRALRNALPSLLVLGVLTACGSGEPAATKTSTPSPSTQNTQTSAGPPPVPEPTGDGTCPYLESAFVAEANGQLVRKVRLSADRPDPACFFYADATDVQLSVWVFHGDPKTAKAVVDRAAPVAESSPASAPAGWAGGALAVGEGAVYAVAKDGDAVVVNSNQKQTIKAKRIAETVIGNLGL
ncbi:hypothetical protein FHS29_005327 [Saccharothrix tamanrassetensis]|uniref:DUF2020 domain-containing protein n=1 Tax=Saccharothrix tamanrassetensis TaxID=1051531 RepID=A0A841CRF0_9PSEU|nr:DUF2020 domain-containing protein [Saccharothrix tamanrassetensis]MBB5958718.1 hypothetical protein [Saccharothrix tamanrassetensis]